ncbi:entericidin A/B family lipoprotein [Acinetobacter larvae]|uniref:Entericidin n=1 Tax=Acinetobacter larvae TaxID=1789224 RepID=A0A1B2LWU0_9GAMM|nr:entericidin A/B family lipoprotein [Acinetobacter larvae]AOA57406.1 entericidin [Acinetobacter larvae]
MKKVLVASCIAMFVLAGCNTFKGVGEDVSSAGKAVTKTAEKTQDRL